MLVLSGPLTTALKLFYCNQVQSVEKAESTGALPNPVIISVRSMRAFQLIEVTLRDQLVDNLNARLRVLHWNSKRRKTLVQ